MAARKTTRKRAAKPRGKAKPAAAAKGGFGIIGWTAAAAIGVGWVASDGRALSAIHRWTAPDRPVVADRAKPRTEARQAAATRAAPPVEIALVPPVPRERTRVTPSPSPERTASIRPVPAPPRPAASLPAAAMPVPDARPAPREALLPRAPIAPPAAVASQPGGGERHATRMLSLRPAPDGSAAVLGTIETGTLVRVERTAGDWRFVRSTRGGAAGWTDGRYLAGEGGALPASAPSTFVAVQERRLMPLAPIGTAR